jgi:hypothetical protein
MTPSEFEGTDPVEGGRSLGAEAARPDDGLVGGHHLDGG